MQIFDQNFKITKVDAAKYQQQKPFAHAEFDDVFTRQFLLALFQGFPMSYDTHWRILNSSIQKKYTTRTEETLSEAMRAALWALNSSAMIDMLEKLTGISGLIPDPHFDGAGPHMIACGGRLGLHTDYNRNRRLGLHRRVNMLIYLNLEWQERWGGHLELWSHRLDAFGIPKPEKLVKKILPSFGKVVIFNTNDYAFHGHPDPLQCPEGVFRRSIAMYYFTAGDRPKNETWVSPKAGQQTLFASRPGSTDADPQWMVRMYLRFAPDWMKSAIRKLRR